MGILEMKVKTQQQINTLIQNRFSGMAAVHNLDSHQGGRILILWNKDTVDLEVKSSHAQVIHCLIQCKITGQKLHCSMVYGLYSVRSRRELWDSIENYGENMTEPWLVMGDFNCVMSPEEKTGGNIPTNYELKDFNETVLGLGVEDIPYTGTFFTWSNSAVDNTIWSKLDRAMVNSAWYDQMPVTKADFQAPGPISDHSPCIVTIHRESNKGQTPFRFFNMWTKHEEFQNIVQEKWKFEGYGTDQFKLCKMLKGLKRPLKELNRAAFSHITARAERAAKEVEDLQIQLQADLENQGLKESIKQKKKTANFLMEAERQFLTQKAK
ncbi:PREDICTED: uncharacterized protein LOC105969349, partial [Erythranthe guttata]|uniref:uncharacterized protein LOC105969349 n=1 Tax=Erythranthe guttata TaxID=4155 RepID=UPI00064D8741